MNHHTLITATLAVLCAACNTAIPAGPAGADGSPGAPGQDGAQGPDGAPCPSAPPPEAAVGSVALCAVATATTGELGGHLGAGDLCTRACYGSASDFTPRAHMCTLGEAAILRQRAELDGPVWLSGAEHNCADWSSESAADVGPFGAPCDTLLPVACCSD